MNLFYSSGFKREIMSMHVHGIFKKSVAVSSPWRKKRILYQIMPFTNSFLFSVSYYGGEGLSVFIVSAPTSK